MGRKTPAQRLRAERLLTVLYAALACVGAVFLVSTAFSAIASVIDLSEGAFTVMSTLALCAGCFAAAYTAGKRRRRGGIKTGLICGVIIFAAVLLLGILFVKTVSIGGFFSKLLIILSCSAIGGVFGVNSPQRFR